MSKFDIDGNNINIEGEGVLTNCLRTIDGIFEISLKNVKSDISFGFLVIIVMTLFFILKT